MEILNEPQPVKELPAQKIIFQTEVEESPEKHIAQLLKEKGIDDQEAMGALIAWTVEREKKAEASNDLEAYVQFNLCRARLYLEAGLAEGALENFQDAQILALNLGMDELASNIAEEIKQKNW